jgi:hypothetical protein
MLFRSRISSLPHTQDVAKDPNGHMAASMGARVHCDTVHPADFLLDGSVGGRCIEFVEPFRADLR